MPFARTADIMLQVVDAIAYLHNTAGIAHTDLKLENIVRARDDGDDIQVIDLCMAARILDSAAGSIAPRPWMCACVPLYPAGLTWCVLSMRGPPLHAFRLPQISA